MNDTHHRRFVAALSVCTLAAWIATAAEQTHEQPLPLPTAPAVVAAPYESPYPVPQVDPSAPPEEPAPAF